MSTPAQVTEAQLRRELQEMTDLAVSLRRDRAAAADEISLLLRREEALSAERDQLRASAQTWEAAASAHLARCEELRAKIGTRPLGSHPDEQHPRAQTWHQERLNWISEVVQLRDEVERLKNLLLQADELNEDALFKISETMKRAEKAEAELSTLRMLHASEKQAKVERGDMLCECQDELTKERARLDWLEREAMAGDVSLGHYPFSAPNQNKRWALVRNYIEHYADTARAAIDAAMKEGGK